jgi:hypothetical protein
VTGLRARSGALLVALLLAAPPAATADSLPSVSSGHRPGPDILYAPPADAPQLENTGIWQAPPILVSGASAYRDGEFVYQDFLYDDHGAAGVHDQSHVTTFMFTNFAAAPWAGTLTYPNDPSFAGNAADLVELRVKRSDAGTAFRVTLNSLVDPERTAFTIALGSSAEPRAWPHMAGVRSPASLFLTVHGQTAELRDAASGAVVSPTPEASVDVGRRQYDVRIPSAAWDPGASTVRIAAGVGLWDPEAGAYLVPARSAGETQPGGAAPSGAALFNVAFRFDEPTPNWDVIRKAYSIGDWLAATTADASWWRERGQAEALRLGDMSRFSAEVDFAKLASGSDDEAGVPTHGSINRILASRYAFGQGVDFTKMCKRGGVPCIGPFIGQLQPYTLFVPAKERPSRGWGLTLWLHSWLTNHNQYMGSNNESQLGNRGPGSLVATPLARGPDGAYADMAEADVFEVWADVARHYELDPDWVSTGGYSMGAAGGSDLPARWPDLFARAVTAAAVPEGDLVPALRNIPLMTLIGAADEGTDLSRQEAAAARLGALGLRFVLDQFPTADHLTLATNDEWRPVAAFMGDHRVDRDPAQVTYVVKPSRDSARADVVADHAYWLSDLQIRDSTASPIGEIDARSEAFGFAGPIPLGTHESIGTLDGGSHGPMPYRRREQTWAPVEQQPGRDELVIDATNIAHVTIDTRRARLSCSPVLRVTTDGPLSITLGGCAKTLEFGT